MIPWGPRGNSIGVSFVGLLLLYTPPLSTWVLQLALMVLCHDDRAFPPALGTQ